MTFSPLTALTSLVGALIVAALVGWIRKARLIVFVPRLFSYSSLSGKGQVAEVSILNRGFKTEEAIELSLRTSLQYEILGANSNDVTIEGHKLKIPRVGPGDDVTTLLHVEGGMFTSDEIANCLSKESKGRVVSKLEEVPPTGPQRIAIIAFVIAVPTLAYMGMLALDHYFEEDRQSVREATAKLAAVSEGTRANVNETSKLVQKLIGEPKGGSVASIGGWDVAAAYVSLKGPLYAALEGGNLRVDIGAFSRKKDVLTVPFALTNDSSYVVKATFRANSQRSEGRIPSYDRLLSDVLVSPGIAIKKTLNVIVPAQTNNQADKKIYLEVFMTEIGGDSLKITRTVVAE